MLTFSLQALVTRVLLLGTTGVEKVTAWNNLILERTQRATELHTSPPATPRYIDFEKDFLKGESPGELFSFLESAEDVQHHAWHRAWAKLEEELTSSSEDVAIAVHATFVRDGFGTRSFLAPERLTNLGLTHIITLIDDVYSCWWRTEKRASSEHWRGRPSLLQLLFARNAELLIGDLVARSLKKPNIVVSVLHPARVLDRLLFDDEMPRRVYLSFPIAGPRKRQRDYSDTTGIQQVSEFVARAAEFERANRHVVAFCPLAIDELPLTVETDIEVKQIAGEDVNFVRFRPSSKRWTVSDLWGEDILLGTVIDETMLIPQKQVKECTGAIKNELGARDYRLVGQSQSLAVFNPVFDGEEPRGVGAEMWRAVKSYTPVHVYQDGSHDPGGIIDERYNAQPGAMGMPDNLRFTTLHATLDEMLHAAFVT